MLKFEEIVNAVKYIACIRKVTLPLNTAYTKYLMKAQGLRL